MALVKASTESTFTGVPPTSVPVGMPVGSTDCEGRAAYAAAATPSATTSAASRSLLLPIFLFPPVRLVRFDPRSISAPSVRVSHDQREPEDQEGEGDGGGHSDR